MTFLLLLPPLLLIAVGVDLILRPAARAGLRLRGPEWAALTGLFAIVAVAMALAVSGPGTSPLIGWAGIGLSARGDIVSIALALTVGFVGWVVLRFSRVALDGEARQSWFMGWMSLTLAFVLALVVAGNLFQLMIAWIAVGTGLHRLLLFYPERPGAQRAARKKSLSGLVASGALLIAVSLMAHAFGTSDIAQILTAIRDGQSPQTLWIVAGLLGVAAVFKSALIPTHGWLTEVMEAPTPVSALLHAGVVNAGGFLLIRFADVMLAAPGVLAVLALLGGLSALVAAAVTTTQSAVKSSLAWSTCAQMSFMVLQCGLALFPLALLHIVAHSLYKAHAFLSAGTAVEAIAQLRRPGPVAVPGARAVLRAFVLSLAIYGAALALTGLWHEPPQALALGAILVFGVAYLIAQGLADAAPWPLFWRTTLMSLGATFGYFALHWAANTLTAGTLPPPPASDPLIWLVMLLTIVSFGLAAWAQATFPLWGSHPAAAGLRVHLMNGLYINVLTDRLIGQIPSKKG